MSDQSFEHALGAKLRAYRPGTAINLVPFVYHPPDEMRARQWKPGDFIVGLADHWFVVEAKEVKGASFPVSRWSPQQRKHAAEVTAADGDYWLVVRFVPGGEVVAYLGIDVPQRGGLRPEQGHGLNAGRSFEVAYLFQ